MKKHVVLAFALTIIIGCSPKESSPTYNANLDSSISDMAKAIIESETFQNRLNGARSSNVAARSSTNNGKGIYIIQTPTFSFFPFFYDSGFIVFGVLFENKTLKVFPNGTAEFSLDVEDPWALWSEDNLGDFSNSCIGSTGAKFTVKYRGTVEIVEQPWGTEYYINPPYETAINVKARNFILNNADTYDPETDTSYCREDSVVAKTVNLTFIGKANNKGEASDLLNININ